MTALDELTTLFSRLPGLGKKSAARIACHLLKTDQEFNTRLAERIRLIKEEVKFCSECGAFTESDPCPVCSNLGRDRSVICVVEQAQDVLTIEASHEFNGLYHVLGGVIAPLDGVGPERLSLAKLMERARRLGTTEIIVATNPTVEGDTTALYIRRMAAELERDGEGAPKVTRLASGIPVGGDLEYADRLTLARSLRGRSSLDF
jgi:recombination protein RecR